MAAELEVVQAMQRELAAGSVAGDRSEPGFRRVGPLAPIASASAGSRACPKRLTPRACAALQTARTNFQNAATAVSNVQDTIARTVNSFISARRASQPSAGFLQGAMAKIDAGVLATRLQTQAKAGQVLAKLLRADHLDVQVVQNKGNRLTSTQVARIATPAVLDGFVTLGLAPDRQHALGLLTSTLAAVTGRLDLAAVLGATTSTSTYIALYNSITMSELARVVVGQHDQGGLSTSAAQTLINDLARAQSTCGNSSRRIAAIARFVTDVVRLASGATASLLRLGAQPLAAGNLSAVNCQ